VYKTALLQNTLSDKAVDAEVTKLLANTLVEFTANATLTEPVVIQIGYPAGISATVEPYLRIFYYNETTESWELVDSTPDAINKVVTASVTHFSIYRIFALQPAAVDLTAIEVYPNPFKPNDGKLETGTAASGIIFNNLTNGAIVNIYTIMGELVNTLTADLTGKATWDATNENGEEVASGLYIYYITGGDDVDAAKGKIAIVR